MKIKLKLLLATCAVALFSACGNNSTTANTANIEKAAPSTGSPLGNAPDALTMTADAYKPPASEQSFSSMKTRNLSQAPNATSIALGAPLASMTAAANATTATLGKPLQIGFARSVSQTSNEAATQQTLKWKTTPSGGNVAALSFSSTGAKGLRLGLLVTNLPEPATLRYYTNGSATAFEVTGKEVMSILARNIASGDKSDAGRTYWGPVFENAEITLEIDLPAVLSTNSIEVSIPTVMHSFRSLSDAEAMSLSDPSQTCNVDVNCASPRPAASDAVAKLNFVVDGLSYICTGTMLNNTTNDGKPYLLTANHCINSQTIASTLYTSWFLRSPSCNSPNSSSTGFPVGATMLYTATSTDSTLLRLSFNNATSYGVLFAGWDATPSAAGLAIADIHHPKGDPQRISKGSLLDFYTRDTQGNFLYSNVTNSTFYGVTLTSGLVEGGSSGSGLFKNISSTNAQLIGQLWGGAAGTCSTATSSNPQELAFGRFDKAFNAGMKVFLRPDAAAPNPNRQPVYRFYIPQSGVYFYTIYASERDDILATKSNAFTYEGIAFYASPTPTAGFSGIYRFRNKTTGAYLYTISEVEKTEILQNYPQFLLEGTAWYAEQGPAGGGSPLFRFRTTNGTHIYTAYDSEKASILANYPGFVLEGPAYYVKLAP